MSRTSCSDFRGNQSKANYFSRLIFGALRSVGHPIDFFAQEAKVVTIIRTAQNFAKFLISVCLILNIYPLTI